MKYVFSHYNNILYTTFFSLKVVPDAWWLHIKCLWDDITIQASVRNLQKWTYNVNLSNCTQDNSLYLFEIYKLEIIFY